MPVLKPAAVRAQIAKGDLAPLYLVTGEDETEKAALLATFSDAVEPDLRAFNVDRLYGAETSVTSFLDAARTLPMMASRRIIVVLQADRMLMPAKRESAAAEKDQEDLEAFIKDPEPHATVVFAADALDGRRAIAKLLNRHAVVVECGARLGDHGDAEQWVRARIAEHAMAIDRDAVRLLVERAGLNVGRLRAEVERLCLYAEGHKSITAQDVLEVSGLPTSQDAWAMNNAIEAKKTAAALRELSLAFQAGGVPLMILGQLRTVVERHILPERQGQAFDALLRTDLALKTSTGDPQVLLERLVVELCEWVRPPRGGAPARWR